jgi:(1->4)-alpha-D-glucan 1-alpha-D-glucosylmutase
MLRGEAAARFLASFVPFARQLARLGAGNSLSQVLLKVAAPGVPDFYQGTELWDLTLVDPDNRRPVDFARRRELARDLAPLVALARAGDPASAPRVAELLASWPDGRIKLFTTLASLGLRRDQPRLFLDGRYLPLDVSAPAGAEAVAFARLKGEASVIAIAPTLTLALNREDFPLGDAWGDGSVALPADVAGATWTNVLTGERLSRDGAGSRGSLRLADAFRTLPIALLRPQP